MNEREQLAAQIFCAMVPGLTLHQKDTLNVKHQRVELAFEYARLLLGRLESAREPRG